MDTTPTTPNTEVKKTAPTREGGGRPDGNRRERSRRPSREARVKPEFDQRVLEIRRVTRVAAGGKRFNFSVALVAGNRKGQVGVGLGKGADTALAMDKAYRNAKHNLVRVPLTKTGSIPHMTSAKYCASVIVMEPSAGRGLVAGSATRDVLELAGVKDTVAKIRSGSKNRLNNARAAFEALKKLTGAVMTKAQ